VPLLTEAIPMPYLFDVYAMQALLSDCSAVWTGTYVGAWKAEQKRVCKIEGNDEKCGMN
jgi:hypothetical protein